jgi:hypothetical protein
MTADARDRTTARRSGRRHSAPALAVLAVAALALTVAPTRALAAPITSQAFTASIPVTPTDWSPGDPQANTNPIVVPKFDPSLGKLDAVNITLGYTFQNDFSMNFSTPASITLTAQHDRIVVDRPNLSAIVQATPADISKTQLISGGPFPQTVAFPTVTRTGQTAPISLTSASDLALFTALQAGDKVKLPLFASAMSGFSADGNGYGVVKTRAGAVVTVTYTYDPVPEPTGLAIFGVVAVAALALRSRNRRRV